MFVWLLNIFKDNLESLSFVAIWEVKLKTFDGDNYNLVIIEPPLK